MTKDSEMKTLSVKIPADVHKALKLYCVEVDKEMQEVVSALIMIHIEKEKQKKVK
ncbi:MAG: hypothetical protein HQL06_11985 [Nitrospirae bacterium]|nr:hypothetical protein [Nitrospirota bacterium]